MKRFEINNYLWSDNGYEPKAWAELHLTDDKLYIKLTACEKDPCARFAYGPDAHVYWDSCLECFLSFNGSKYYMNLEANSIGGYYSAYRTGMDNCRIVDVFSEDGKPKPTVTDDMWYVEITLDMAKVKELFCIEKVESLRGNFYKCGDETPLPHFGMWSVIRSDEPAFHKPEFFGDIDIAEIS
jgi:hypothetical protein